MAGVPEKTLSNRGQRRGWGGIGIVVDRIERGLAPVVTRRCQVVAEFVGELTGMLHYRIRSWSVPFDTAHGSWSCCQPSAGSGMRSVYQNYRVRDRHQAEQVTAKVRPLR